MDGRIIKGRVLSIEGRTVKAAPADNIDNVSPEIDLAEWIKDGEVAKEDVIAYCLFQDNTGLVIAKLQ